VKLLTRLRTERGWTRAELGRQARIGGARIGEAENGMVRLYPVELARLAVALEYAGQTHLLDEVDDDVAAG